MIQSYNDLPIGKYLDILALDKDGLSDLDYQVAVVGILADLTPDEVLDLPLPEYQKHVAAAQFLTAPVLGKDGRSPYDGKRVPQSYTLAGLQLDLTTKAEKMTAAQYIDFQTFAKEPVKHQAELLSCVLIPHGMTYNDGYEITDVHKAIRENLSVAECYALSAFFLREYAGSTLRTLYSSRWTLKRKPRKTKEEKELLRKIDRLIVSPSGGAGWLTLTRWQNLLTRAGLPSGR